MKKFLSGAGRVILTVGILGGMTGGGYFLYKALTKEENKVLPKISEEFGNYEVRINEYYDQDEYLGQNGITMMKERIKNDLGFGPEISGLDSINFSDGKFITKDNNGTFYSATKEIFINTSALSQLVPYNSSIESKVEIAFQVLFHEYGHYIADSYFKKSLSTTEVADIYAGDSRIQEGWSKEFIDEFKKDLNYNSADLYKNQFVYDSNNNPTSFKPLASVYSLKELFDISNGKNSPTYSKPLTNLSWTGARPSLKPSNVEEDKLEYMFDMNELFTRKYQQMRMGFNPVQGSNLKIGEMDSHGWITSEIDPATNKHKRLASPFLIDTLKYQDTFSGNRNGVSTTFFNDNPYFVDTVTNKKAAEGLFDIYLKGFGQKGGSDISFITTKNDSKMVSDGGYELPDNNDNLIKFGGYITQGQSQKYNYVGYEVNGVFQPIKISTSKFSVGYKTSLDGNVDTHAVGEDYFYTLDDWVDANALDGKRLYFSEDKLGTNKTPMISVKSGAYGNANTWYYDTPRNLKDWIFSAKLNASNEVIITKETWRGIS